MSARKVLVKFEKEGQAKVVQSSMPGKKRKSNKVRKNRSNTSNKPRVIKGRVNIRVAGYSGIQKVPPSQLIPFLPIAKVKQAAKRALSATGQGQKVKRQRQRQRKRKNK